MFIDKNEKKCYLSSFMGKEGIDPFYALRQDSPFAMVKNDQRSLFNLTHADITRTRIISREIQEFLNIKDNSEIPALLTDEKRIRKNSRRAYSLLARTYGIKEKPTAAEVKINGFGNIADGTIFYLRTGPFSIVESHLEPVNEVETQDNLYLLQLICFDKSYDPIARFEAARKIHLARTFGITDQKRRAAGTEKNFSRFLNILNHAVLSSEESEGIRHGIGWARRDYLLSTHNPKDVSCSDVTLLSQEEAKDIKLEENQKRTLLRRRVFNPNARLYTPVYMTPREKTSIMHTLKMLRKNEDNADAAVDDDIGLMVVLNNERQVRNFLDHLIGSAEKIGSFVFVEEIEDRLKKCAHKSDNESSSPYVRYLKCFVRMDGMRAELELHTNETYVEYKYRDGVSHKEYETRRLFVSQIPQLLFPEELYDVPWDNLYPVLINNIRQQMRQTKGEFV